MQEFKYEIKDEMGIHARPAGLLVKVAAKFSSTIKITANGKTVDAKRIMGVMGLGAKMGQEIVVTAEGDDETEAIKEVQSFVVGNL